MSYRVRSVDELAHAANISNTVIENTDAIELVFEIAGKRVIDADDLYDFFKAVGKENWQFNYRTSLSPLESELTKLNGERIAKEIKDKWGVDSYGDRPNVYPALDGNHIYISFRGDTEHEHFSILNQYGNVVEVKHSELYSTTVKLKYQSPIKLNS